MRTRTSILKKKDWITLYEEARSFFLVHDRFPTRREDPRIYIWANHWWSTGGPSKYPDKAQMLVEIGFTVRNRAARDEYNWWSKYHRLKEYHDKNGHFPTWTEDKPLRAWLVHWCSTHIGQEPEKFKLLAEIGYTYNQIESSNLKNNN